MWFKRNITITIACVITEFLICLIPTIFMIYVLFLRDKISEILSTLMIVPCFILLANVFLLAISLISLIFIKTKYKVGADHLVVVTKSKTTEIKYDTIARIAYDFGYLLSRYNLQPSQLVLFDSNHNQLLSINNPSIIMTFLICKKCNGAKITYHNNKRFLWLLAVVNGIFLLFSIIITILS